MVAPLVIAGIAAGVAAVLSTATSMVGGYMQGKAQEKYYKYKAKEYRRLAGQTKLSEQMAMRKQRLATRRMIGSQRATMAGSGIDINFGSPLDLQVETGRLGAMDAAEVRRNYEWKRWSLLTEAAGMEYQGKLAGKLKWFGMASSFMSGLGQGANSYLNYQAAQKTT